MPRRSASGSSSSTRSSTSPSGRARSRISATGSAPAASASRAAASGSTSARSPPSCRRTTSARSRPGCRCRWAATRSARTASSPPSAGASRAAGRARSSPRCERLAAGGVKEVTLLGPERQLLGPRPAPRHPHRVRRAAASVRRGRRDRADPVHEPAPEGLPRAGDRGDGRVRSGLRARPPAAAVGVVAPAEGDAPDVHARALPRARREVCARRSPTSRSAPTSSSASRARPRPTSQRRSKWSKEIGYDSAFTFVYSPRAGTEAAAMPDQVPHEVKIERMERLVELTQRRRARAERGARRPRRAGARRRAVPHRSSRAARPDAPQHDGQLHRRRGRGAARRRPDRVGDVHDPARIRAGSGRRVTAANVSITSDRQD